MPKMKRSATSTVDWVPGSCTGKQAATATRPRPSNSGHKAADGSAKACVAAQTQATAPLAAMAHHSQALGAL